MSEGVSRRRTTSSQTRQRRKGATRGGRHGLSRPPVAVAGDDFVIQEPSAIAAPARHRRATSATPTPSVGISREAEFAYIRSDMRRLFIIAAALLALMVVLLLLVNQ